MYDHGEILLIEANSNDIGLILAALSENQLSGEVFVVRDGKEALGYLHTGGECESRAVKVLKLVLLGVKLPKLDGSDVLHRIEADPDLKTMPVVMFTPPREERDVLRSYDLGANTYAMKPIGFQEFVEVVKEFERSWGVIGQRSIFVE